jgi:hypothetical protein
LIFAILKPGLITLAFVFAGAGYAAGSAACRVMGWVL